MNHQLPLNIQLRDDASFASFFPGDNTEALKAASELSRGISGSFVYLWGQEGVGRTHLLQASCQAAAEKNASALYLPLEEHQQLSVQALQGIESLALVCLDNVQAIAGLSDWEEAFFHLFNQLAAQGGRLLISADVAPKYLAIVLPDLKSRLASGLTYQLHRLSDAQKISALQLRARQRGLQLSKALGQFLLNRCARTMPELFTLLETLDRASLAEQRRLTIPFAKQILKI